MCLLFLGIFTYICRRNNKSIIINMITTLVQKIMCNEDSRIKELYSSLPFQGTIKEQNECLQLLYRHSRDVADLALEITARHPELNLDTTFLEQAALLHDIGVVWTNAPSIHCHGDEPYIRHGEIGKIYLSNKGHTEYGNVAARHTGAGISDEDIILQKLPIEFGALPISLEEKLICYADKFFSKSHPERRKTQVEARKSLEKFGEGTLMRFDAMVELFGEIK